MLVKRENSCSHLWVIDHRRESSNQEGLQGAIWLGHISEQVRPQTVKTVVVFGSFKNVGKKFFSVSPKYLILRMSPTLCRVWGHIQTTRVTYPKTQMCTLASNLPCLHFFNTWHIIYPNSQSLASSSLFLSPLSKHLKDSNFQVPLHTDFTQQPATLTILVQVIIMSISKTVCLPRGVSISTHASFTQFSRTRGKRHKILLWVLVTHFNCGWETLSVISWPAPSLTTLPLCWSLNTSSSFPLQETWPHSLFCSMYLTPNLHTIFPCLISISIQRSPSPTGLLG